MGRKDHILHFCNCGIKGHLGKVCHQAKRCQQQPSFSSAAEHPPLDPVPLAHPLQSAASPAHGTPDNSFVFAMKQALGSQKAASKRLHRQRQPQRQREQAIAAGRSLYDILLNGFGISSLAMGCSFEFFRHNHYQGPSFCYLILDFTFFART